MAVLRLTSANLTFVKRGLRQAFPAIKSSHLSEALASALGYRTHASLLADADGESPVALDAERWEARLESLGYKLEGDPLTPLARAADLPDPCWREIAKRDLGAINDWFAYCKAHDMPDLFISLGRKYARLEWDCISTSGRGDDGLKEKKEGRSFGSWMFSKFQEHARGHPGKPFYEGSSFVGTIERLQPDTARDLADLYFMALYQAVRAGEEVSSRHEAA